MRGGRGRRTATRLPVMLDQGALRRARSGSVTLGAFLSGPLLVLFPRPRALDRGELGPKKSAKS